MDRELQHKVRPATVSLTFPIMSPMFANDAKRVSDSGQDLIRRVPWGLVKDHEAQAVANHGQTVERLYERGGVSACEAVAILLNRPWRRMPIESAYRQLGALVREHLDKSK